MKFIFAILCFCISTSMFGQGVQINELGSIRPLMEHYKQLNKDNIFVQGWRIQIITTDDRRRMERAISLFRSQYPDVNSDWQHVSPYYLVKVGAFRDKLDYQSFLQEVKQSFPSAFPVNEKLRKEELLR